MYTVPYTFCVETREGGFGVNGVVMLHWEAGKKYGDARVPLICITFHHVYTSEITL